MDIFGTTAAAFALAEQLFKPTLALYSAYSASKDYNQDILDRQIQLRVECIRYETWGEYMGLKADISSSAGHEAEDHAEPVMQEWWKTHRSHLNLVVDILCLISRRLVDLEKFQQKYDQHKLRLLLVPKTPTDGASTGSTPIDNYFNISAIASSENDVDEAANIHSPSELTALITKRIVQYEALATEHAKSRKKRLSSLKFELFGKGRLDDLISDLRRYNDNLEELTGYQAPLRGKLFSRLLDSSSTEPLNQQLQDLTQLGSAAASVQPVLAEMARRKAEFLRLKEQATSASGTRTIARDPGASLLYSAFDLKNRQSQKSSMRDFCTYEGLPVILEWKILNTDLSEDEGLLRVRDLAAFLGSHGHDTAGQHISVNNSLHLLNCLGYLKEPGRSDTVALVYSINSSPCVTLSEILRRTDRFGLTNFDLGTRFRLARQLAECVFYLHLTGWLHKSINSDNILVIGDDRLPGDTQNLNLFLAGFNTARLDTPGHSSEKFAFDEETDLYHHPNYQGANRQFSLYSRQYDIYSLGLVLLELGSWAPLHRLGQYDARTHAHDQKKFYSRLIRKYGPLHYLTSKTGNAYKKAVLWCLKDQFETTSAMSEEQRSQVFWEEVVIRLANTQITS